MILVEYNQNNLKGLRTANNTCLQKQVHMVFYFIQKINFGQSHQMQAILYSIILPFRRILNTFWINLWVCIIRHPKRNFITSHES